MANDRTQAGGLKVGSNVSTGAVAPEFPVLPQELQDRLSHDSLKKYQIECEVFVRQLTVALRTGA